MNGQKLELAQLIAAFFDALDVHRQFDKAASIIADLRTAPIDADAYLWADYFTGILAEEKERDWAQAEACYLQVLAQNLPALLKAQVFLSLGIAYDKQGRWDDALVACENSITQWQQVGDQIKLALALRQMAIVYCNGFDGGEYPQAILTQAKASCHQALALLIAHPEDATNSPVPFYIAATWQVLGRACSNNGEHLLAIECYDHYLQLAKRYDYPFHIGFAQWSLANSFQLAGQWEAALVNYEQAQHCFQHIDDTYHLFHVLAHKGSLYRKLAENQQALECFNQSLALMETVRTGVSTEAARSGFFSTVVGIFDNTILALLEQKNINGAFDCTEQARARSFLDALSQGEHSFAARLEANPATLKELQTLVPTNTLVLEYYTTRTSVSYDKTGVEKVAANSVLFSAPTTILFAITRSTANIYTLNVSPDDLLLNAGTDQLAQLILPVPVRRLMYEKLLTPIAHLLQGKRRLYIIPHGPLHYIPFHALIAPDGDTLLREDGPEIVYAPSATILFRERQRQGPPAPGSCLAVGYNGDEGLELHFAEEEAAYIARMAQGTALVGPAPKKAALYAQAPNYRALHFSCHGEFDPDAPLQSLLHIGPGETLTGQEIMDNLRLNCNLVTLSACESGLSKVQRGDELYGLIRAFMYAGAPAIIATLWQVDERSTLIFAEKFYALIQQGLPYATALKAAQLYLRQLTRKEALLTLSQHIAQHASGGEISPLRQAYQYLKSFATQPLLVDDPGLTADPLSNPLLHGEDDAEPIFADPKFWAPFVLIGDPQIGHA